MLAWLELLNGGEILYPIVGLGRNIRGILEPLILRALVYVSHVLILFVFA